MVAVHQGRVICFLIWSALLNFVAFSSNVVQLYCLAAMDNISFPRGKLLHLSVVFLSCNYQYSIATYYIHTTMNQCVPCLRSLVTTPVVRAEPHWWIIWLAMDYGRLQILGWWLFTELGINTHTCVYLNCIGFPLISSKMIRGGPRDMKHQRQPGWNWQHTRLGGFSV